MNDKIIVIVADNNYSFKISAIATNTSTALKDNRITATSAISVVSNSIEGYNSNQNQYYDNIISSIMVNGKTLYIYKNKLYETLNTYKIYRNEKSDLTAEYFIKYTYLDIEYDFKIKDIKNIDEIKRDICTLANNPFKLDSAKTEMMVSRNNYTLYVFTNESQYKIQTANVDDKTFECSIVYEKAESDTEEVYNSFSSHNGTYIIMRNLIDSYYTKYTHITVTLLKEFSDKLASYGESFTGFRLEYENGESVFYDVKQYGFSFSFVVEESVTLYAEFETVYKNVGDALLDAMGNSGTESGTNPDTSSPSPNYGAVQFDAPEETKIVTTTNIQASTYIHSFAIKVALDFIIIYEFDYKDNIYKLKNNEFPAAYKAMGYDKYFSVEGDESTAYTDDFNQKFYSNVRVMMPKEVPNLNLLDPNSEYTVIYKLFTLNISVTQNNSANSQSNSGNSIVSSVSNLLLFYPYEFANRTEAANDVHFINNEKIYTYFNGYLYPSVRDKIENGVTVQEHYKDPYLVRYADAANEKYNIKFSDTLNKKYGSFIDGFYSYEHNINLQPGVENTGLLSGTKADNNGNWDGNVIIITYDGKTTIPVTYNFFLEGSVKIYIVPSYMVQDKTGSENKIEYRVDLPQSQILSMTEEEIIEGTIFVNTTDAILQPKAQSDVEKYAGGPNLFYYQVDYKFSAPLTFAFNSPYLTFDHYYYVNNNGEKIKLENSNSNVTLKTNNSVITMSYLEEFRLLLGEQVNEITLDNNTIELYCVAKESIKTTSFTLDVDATTTAVKPNYDISLSGDEESYGNGYKTKNSITFDNTGINTNVELYYTDENGVITDEATAIADGKPYKLIVTVNHSTKTNGRPKISLLYGQDFVTKNATFSVSFNDFDPQTSYAGSGTYLHLMHLDTYSLEFKSAYCANATQKVTISKTTTTSPVVSFTLDSTFADNNEIIIQTDKYFLIYYYTNYIGTGSGDADVSLNVNYSKTNITYTTSENNKYYMYAFIQEGSAISLIANISNNNSVFDTQEKKNKYLIYRYDKTAGNANTILTSYDTYFNGIEDGVKRYTRFEIRDSSKITFASDVVKKHYSDFGNSFLGIDKLTPIKADATQKSYSFVPKSNLIYLADYLGIVVSKNVTNKFIGVLAPGNSSNVNMKLDIKDNPSYRPTKENSAYNFAVDYLPMDKAYIFTETIKETDKYSAIEYIEESDSLFLTEDDLTTTDSIRVTEFKPISETNIYVMSNKDIDKSVETQTMLLVKSGLNKNGAKFGYTLSRLVSEGKPTIIDYVYSENITNYTMIYSGNPDDIVNKYAFNQKTGKVDFEVLGTDGATKYRDKTGKFVAFTKESINDKPIHGMTLYIKKGAETVEYYILNNVAYTYDNKTNTLVQTNLFYESIFVNVNYNTYDVNIVPMLITFEDQYTLKQGKLYKGTINAANEITTKFDLKYTDKGVLYLQVTEDGRNVTKNATSIVVDNEYEILTITTDSPTTKYSVSRSVKLFISSSDHALVEYNSSEQKFKEEITDGIGDKQIEISYAYLESSYNYKVVLTYKDLQNNDSLYQKLKYKGLVGTIPTKSEDLDNEAITLYIYENNIYTSQYCLFDDLLVVDGLYVAYDYIQTISATPVTYSFTKGSSASASYYNINNTNYYYDDVYGKFIKTSALGSGYITVTHITFATTAGINSLFYKNSDTSNLYVDRLCTTKAPNKFTYSSSTLKYDSTTITSTKTTFKLYNTVSSSNILNTKDYIMKNPSLYYYNTSLYAVKDSGKIIVNDISVEKVTIDSNDYYIANNLLFTKPTDESKPIFPFEYYDIESGTRVSRRVKTGTKLDYLKSDTYYFIFPQKLIYDYTFTTTTDTTTILEDSKVYTLESVNKNPDKTADPDTVAIATYKNGSNTLLVKVNQNKVYSYFDKRDMSAMTIKTQNFTWSTKLNVQKMKTNGELDGTSMISKTERLLKETTVLQRGGEIRSNYATVSLRSVTEQITAAAGYYVKGFIITSDFDHYDSFFLHYQETSLTGTDPSAGASTNILSGLQNLENYSLFKYTTFIPITYALDYLSGTNGAFSVTTSGGIITSITLNFDIRLNGNLNLYIVYAPVIYQISAIKLNAQENIKVDAITGDEYIMKNDMLYYYKNVDTTKDEFKTYDTSKDAPVGYIKGTMVVEYGRSTFIKAAVYDGSQYIGYSLGKNTDATKIETAYTSANINDKMNQAAYYAGQVYDAFRDGKDLLELSAPKEGEFDSQKYDYSKLLKIDGTIDDSPSVQFMNKDGIQIKNNRVILDGINSATNNIMVFNVKKDIQFYIFYKAVSYTLEINLAQNPTGVSSTDSSVQSYLTFVNTENPVLNLDDPSKIVNPQISFENGTTVNYKYKVHNVITDVNDKLVYTAFDNYGRLIVYDDGNDKAYRIQNGLSSFNDRIYGVSSDDISNISINKSIVFAPVLNSSVNIQVSRQIGYLLYNDNGSGLHYAPSLRRISTKDSLYKLITDANTPTVDNFGTFYTDDNKPTIYLYDGKAYLKSSAIEYFVRSTADFGNLSTLYNENSFHTDRNNVDISQETFNYLYELIPISELDTYAEYTNNYLEDSYNMSTGYLVKDSYLLNMKNSLTDYVTYNETSKDNSGDGITTGTRVSSNNKYIYSILNIKPTADGKFGNISITLDKSSDDEEDLGSPIVHHVKASEINISYSSSRQYATFNTKVRDPNDPDETKVLEFAVVTDLYINDVETNPRWWQYYTTTYVDSILKMDEKSEEYQKMSSILVFKKDVDEQVCKNLGFTISTNGLNTSISNYTDYLDFTRDTVSLKKGLFKLQIGNDLEFDSSKFSQSKREFDRTITTNKTSFELKQTGTEVNPFSTGNDKFAATFSRTVDQTKYGLVYSIKVTIKLFCDSTGSLPSVKILTSDAQILEGQGEGSMENPNIKVDGFTIDYEYSPASLTSDTIYKPSGDFEKLGTKAGNPDTQSDSYFRANGMIEGFFINPYVNKQQYEYPNFNVKVNLIFKQNVKTMNSTLSLFVENERLTIDRDMNTDNAINFKLTNPGNETIFDGKNKSNIGKLFTDNIIPDTWNSQDKYYEGSRELLSKTLSGMFIDHYYVYIIKDAYLILDMLDFINKNLDFLQPGDNDKFLALSAYKYITTFDPHNFVNKYDVDEDCSKNNGFPRYVLSSTKANSEDEYYSAYQEIYDMFERLFINNSYLNTIDTMIEHLNQFEIFKNNADFQKLIVDFKRDIEVQKMRFYSLPIPRTVDYKYLYIERVDVLTSAFSGIDHNFINLNFTQNDLIITASEVRELYQRQIDSDKITHIPLPFTDKTLDIPSWDASQAYSYCNKAVSNIAMTKAEGMHGGDVSGSEINDSIAGSDSQKNKDTSSYFWCYGNALSGTFQKLLRSALAIPKQAFNSNTDTMIDSKVIIHDIAPLDKFRKQEPDTYDKVLTARYDFDPTPGKVLLKKGVTIVFGAAGEFVFNAIDGKSFEQCCNEALNTMLNSGVIGLVKGVVSIWDKDVRKSFKQNYLH
ncbi:MAG: hypothetical protein IJX17_08135 [Clostridia bacterium]|nr:hypothetical protein [Clostridia bacterium]